jgi:hypothetical protein
VDTRLDLRRAEQNRSPEPKGDALCHFRYLTTGEVSGSNVAGWPRNKPGLRRPT